MVKNKSMLDWESQRRVLFNVACK